MDSIWTEFVRWIYNAIYDAMADLFSGINYMGTEIFNLSWITAVIQLFNIKLNCRIEPVFSLFMCTNLYTNKREFEGFCVTRSDYTNMTQIFSCTNYAEKLEKHRVLLENTVFNWQGH